MKIIVAGSRTIKNKQEVFHCISNGIMQLCKKEPSPLKVELVSGGAKGVDTLADDFAKIWKMEITIFHANWNQFGKRAGYLRNILMADYVGEEGALIAIWDGKSRGTKMMIDIAKKKGMAVVIYENR